MQTTRPFLSNHTWKTSNISNGRRNLIPTVSTKICFRLISANLAEVEIIQLETAWRLHTEHGLSMDDITKMHLFQKPMRSSHNFGVLWDCMQRCNFYFTRLHDLLKQCCAKGLPPVARRFSRKRKRRCTCQRSTFVGWLAWKAHIRTASFLSITKLP